MAAGRPGLLLLCVSSCLLTSTTATADTGVKCEKDPSLGDNFNFNVYYCQDDAKPRCCQVDDEFTCCATDTVHTAQEQAILWGSVGGAVCLLILICVCYHKDSRLCDPGQGCCCGRCSRKKEEKVPFVAEEDFFDPEVARGKTPLDLDRLTGIGPTEQDQDSGRGSACSTPSYANPYPRPESSASAMSAMSARSARSARTVSSAGSARSASSLSARSDRTTHSVTPEPDNMADIQL